MYKIIYWPKWKRRFRREGPWISAWFFPVGVIVEDKNRMRWAVGEDTDYVPHEKYWHRKG